MVAIKDTPEQDASRSICDFILVRGHLYALRRAVKKRSEKKEIFLLTSEFTMARNHSNVTLQIAKEASQHLTCFKTTRRSINLRDLIFAATAIKSSYDLQL
jgi:predicted nucleic acid-binding protein